MNNEENSNQINNNDNQHKPLHNTIKLSQLVHGEITDLPKETKEIPNPINNQVSNNETINNNQVNNNTINKPETLNTNPNNTGQINPINKPYVINNSTVSNPNKNSNQKKYLSTEEMVTSYVGKNYNKFVYKNFNFAAFFFSTLYLLYRKMYGYAFLIMAGNVLLSLIIKDQTILLIANIIINIILGFKTNRMYIKHCKNKVENIRYKYSHYDNDSLLLKCHKKGGASILSVIFGFIFNTLIITGFFVIYLIVFLKISISDIFNKITNDYLKIGLFGSPSNKFNGVISYDTSIIIKDEFSVDIPSEFKENMMNGNYSYDYEYVTENNNCQFRMLALEGYTSDKKFIEEIKDYQKDNKPVLDKITINDKAWYRLYYKNPSDEYWYAYTKNNKVYLIKYMILKDDDNKQCQKYQDTIINSVIEK